MQRSSREFEEYNNIFDELEREDSVVPTVSHNNHLNKSVVFSLDSEESKVEEKKIYSRDLSKSVVIKSTGNTLLKLEEKPEFQDHVYWNHCLTERYQLDDLLADYD